jgi:hypothetical protein
MTTTLADLVTELRAACPCEKSWGESVPALSRCQYTFCKCRQWEPEVLGLPREAFVPCKWPGHAFEERMIEGWHTINCECDERPDQQCLDDRQAAREGR